MEKTIFIHTYINTSPRGEVFLWEKPEKSVPAVDLSVKTSELLLKTAKTTAIIGIAILFVAVAPYIWNKVKTSGSKIFAKSTVNEVQVPESLIASDYQPRFDASLPLDNRIRIPSIGIDAVIQESTLENFEDALKKGIWRVSDWGTPYTRNKPTIMAAHRYGYLAWNNIFRRENSFFNLPKLEEGEIVEIIWRQRKYTYEVFNTTEGEQLLDYNADLILYTCESLSSPVRIYKYARLLEI